MNINYVHINSDQYLSTTS